jgi:putative flippase GtrA
MRNPLERLPGMADPDTRRKLFRYAVASGVNVLVGEGTLAVMFGIVGWTARSAAVLAAVVAAFPAYVLARRWVWGRSGRSHLLKEVLPFWTLALLGLVITTVAADVGERVGADASSRLVQTGVVMAFVLGAAAVFWVIRFLLLNHILFADRGDVPD